jgi:hypothetical protein
MAFSLRTLLAAVVVAALAAAAIATGSLVWASATVTVTVVVLIAATLAAWFKPEERRYYGAFALVGWLYAGVLYLENLQTLELDLLSSRLLFTTWKTWKPQEFESVCTAIGVQAGPTPHYPYMVLVTSDTKYFARGAAAIGIDYFRAFYTASQALLTLCFAAIAGAVSSTFFRPRSPSRAKP